MAITTMAINARIIAYSTNPCPLSCSMNNMDEFLSESKFEEKSGKSYGNFIILPFCSTLKKGECSSFPADPY
jgi:hypothetical protein